LRKRKPTRQRTGTMWVQHSPTAAALSTSFLLNHAPNSPELNALITDLGSHIQQREYELWFKKIEEIKQRLVEFWQCSNTASENAIFELPVLPDSVEVQVTWGGILKRLLIAYFAKKNTKIYSYVSKL